jgi:hypothetical protein
LFLVVSINHFAVNPFASELFLLFYSDSLCDIQARGLFCILAAGISCFMELIRPTEITGKICSLIDDAHTKLIIVSPYNALVDSGNKPWKKMIKCLEKAKNRHVELLYFARDGENHKGLDILGITPVLIERLHAKMYLNDTYAIFTSMNLVVASDEASLDFAVKTETEAEYKQALDYFERYIRPHRPVPSVISEYADEIPMYDHFKGIIALHEPDTTMHKVYHPQSHFIKEFGFKQGERKIGVWYYFTDKGLMHKSERHGEETICTELDFSGKVSRYDIIFSLANMVGGLYKCSLEQLYFKSKIQPYIADNPDLFYNHLKTHLRIDPIDKTCYTFESLIEDLHSSLRRKPAVIGKTT